MLLPGAEDGPLGLEFFVRALFGYHRRRGCELDLQGQCAAVSFVQHFGSSLQCNPYFHVLVPPEGLFAPASPGTDERATCLPLHPTTDEEMESLLRTVAGRVVCLLRRLGRLDEDAFPQDTLQAASIQRRLPFSPPCRAPTSTQA